MLLRPGWLALTVAVFAFAIACFTLLSPWQFNRHDERSGQNTALRNSLSSTPRPLDEVLPDSVAPDQQTEWSLVTITGRYLPEHEVVARLRIIQGEPAFEVLTPLRTRSGEVVLIDRGYVPPDERTQVPDYAAAPGGEVTVVARARVDEPISKDRTAISDPGGKTQVYRVGTSEVTRATGQKLRPGYFQLSEGQPGVLGALPLPRLEAGPFFSYALQWIAFGAMALLAWLYFTLRELKPGGALAEPGRERPAGPSKKRKSVAEMLAEDDEPEPAGDKRPPSAEDTATGDNRQQSVEKTAAGEVSASDDQDGRSARPVPRK